MKKILTFWFILLIVTAGAQESIKFKVEKPTKFQSIMPTLGDGTQLNDTVIKRGKLGSGLINKREQGNQNGKFQQSNDVREEWLKRGGKVHYVSIMLTVSHIGMDIEGFGKMNVNGGGYSFYTNFINLKMPEYKLGQANWNSFNWGLGYDIIVYSLKFPKVAGVDMNSTYLNFMITGNFGWTWGLGKFKDEGNWKGIALTLKYKPSYNISMVASTIEMPPSMIFPDGYTSTSTDVSGSFNAGGFGFDIDFASFSATMNKLAPKPKTKFSFFFLPPIGDSPLFISASLGVIFYPRPRGFLKRR